MIGRMDWVKLLKPGDVVRTNYPDQKLKTATIEYIMEDNAFHSNYAVKLEEFDSRLDSFWIHPVNHPSNNNLIQQIMETTEGIQKKLLQKPLTDKDTLQDTIQFQLDECAYQCRDILDEWQNAPESKEKNEAYSRLIRLQDYIAALLNNAKGHGFVVSDVETGRNFCRYILK